MNDKELDKLIDEAVHIPVPAGLAERLENQIDTMVSTEKKNRFKRFIYWSASAASIILLCLGIFFKVTINPYENKLADTYSDPKEAAIAAEKALAFLSVQLNKGIDQVNDAGQEIEKVNQILNKHLKD